MLNGFEDKIKDVDLTSEGALQQIVAIANAQADKLVDKNSELIGKLQSAKENGTASTAELEALRLFKQNSEIKLQEEGSQYQAAKQSLIEQHNTEIEKLTADIKSKDTSLTELLINGGLNKALDLAGVSNPALKQGAEAILRSQAQIIEGKAMIGDKSLSDAVKEWSETDAGKSFVTAPINQGGDAAGGGAGKANKLSDLTLTQQAKLANTDLAEYQRLKG